MNIFFKSKTNIYQLPRTKIYNNIYTYTNLKILNHVIIIAIINLIK